MLLGFYEVEISSNEFRFEFSKRRKMRGLMHEIEREKRDILCLYIEIISKIPYKKIKFKIAFKLFYFEMD
jgi:hypothetical protein